MKRALWLGALLAISVSCKSSALPAVAGAAITLGAGVAIAGVYRAITGGCWASCPTGTACDSASGTCKHLPCNNQCPADSKCVVVGRIEECVRRKGGTPFGPPRKVAPEPDPCKGLCAPGEQCAADAGVADCVPPPPPPPK